MLAALKQSTESRQLVELAKKYLQGVRGTLVQAKKLKAEKAAQRVALAQQIAGGIVGPIQHGQAVQRPAQTQSQQFTGQSAIVSERPGAQRQPQQVSTATNGGGGPALQVKQYVPGSQSFMGLDRGSESGHAGTWRDASK